MRSELFSVYGTYVLILPRFSGGGAERSEAEGVSPPPALRATSPVRTGEDYISILSINLVPPIFAVCTVAADVLSV